MPVIEVRGLAKRFGTVTAVDDLSFSVGEGTVTAFLGPNGAGKTTTLRMLLGLVTPSAGTAVINGRTYRDVKSSVGASLEAAGFHPGRTGRGHLRARALARGADGATADELLAMVDLAGSADSRIGTYSLGMRQRLGLAAALLGDPQVLILDEPANGLDPEGIRWMRDLLRTLAAHGRTVLLSSHLLAEMKLLADDLIIIAAGRLAARGTVASIVSSMTYGGRILVRTPEPGKLAAVLGSDAVVTPAGDGDVYITGVDAVAVGDAALRAGIAIYQLVTERPDLEAAFLELTTGKAAIR
jgi:ABC-2 type transport system ATP-binding protein